MPQEPPQDIQVLACRKLPSSAVLRRSPDLLRSLRSDSATAEEEFIGMYGPDDHLIGTIGIKELWPDGKVWLVTWVQGKGVVQNFHNFIKLADANRVKKLVMYARTRGMARWAIRSGWVISRERVNLRWGVRFTYPIGRN